MFNAIAGNYDFLNRVLSLGIDVGWRKKTVRAVARYQPRLLLDVARLRFMTWSAPCVKAATGLAATDRSQCKPVTCWPCCRQALIA